MLSGLQHLAENPKGAADPEVVRFELRRLLTSDQFKNSKRCGDLLNYIVEESLSGRSDQLKERLIGISVFGRRPDYDTQVDPVVRNAASELRKRLTRFYADSGSESAIQVNLHPGAYIPEFRVPTLAAEFPAEPQVPKAKIFHQRTAFAIAASALLVCIFVWLIVEGIPKFNFGRTPSAGTAILGAATSIASPASIDGAIRILAGNLRTDTYIDRFGDQWSSDQFFTGGISRQGLANLSIPAGDPELFHTMREGNFSYDIPLKRDQVYEMRLYFEEPQYRYGNKIGGDGEGTRIFQVVANGQIILKDFDIIEDSGPAPTTVRAFKDISAARDGKLHLQFISRHEQPLISAIELFPSSPGTIPPIRIRASPNYYTDAAGSRWSPDNFYIGGALQSEGSQVTETSDPDMFNSERVGNFLYAIPVPPGRYSLTLYFAETFFHDPGARVFDVSCNGAMLMRQLDLVQQVGISRVLKKTFHGLEPNGQGKLLISFSPEVNYASVKALEVVDESR